MTAFLSKLNGAEVAIDVDQLIAQGEQLRRCLKQAEERLGDVRDDTQRKQAQKAVDKYRRRLDQLQVKVTKMFKHGISPAQRAQIADIKYEEQEARKQAATAAPGAEERE